jgi:hypothetical protein
MAIPSNLNRNELHGVVLRTDFGCREQEPQDLRIGCGGPTSHEVQQQKHQQAPEQTVEKIEGGGTQTHREEKEFSFGAKDRQGPRQRPLDLVDSSWSRHVVLLRTR